MEAGPDFATKVGALLSRRLEEIETESRQIKAAVTHLNGSGGPVGRRRSVRRSYVRTADRKAQLIAELENGPGTVAELAKRLVLPKSALYAVAKSLHKEGLAEKNGSVYSLPKGKTESRKAKTPTTKPQPRAAPKSRSTKRASRSKT